MAKRLPCAIIFACLLLGVIKAQAAEPGKHKGFLSMDQVGLRLGAWVNQGDMPPESGSVNDKGATFTTNIKKSAFYFEGYYAYCLYPRMMLEGTVGTVNRGSVRINESGATDIGNLIIYPIQVQLKVYPSPFHVRGLQPYLLAGGGIYLSRRNVQFTTAGSYYSNWETESTYGINYVLGAGVDLPVAGSVGLDFSVKYMPIKLKKTLLTIDRYDAIAFTLGVKYLYLR